MALNPLARELNTTLQQAAPPILAMLSELGKRLYFPRGIISQSAEAKAKASRFNATIGIALENGEPMHLPSILRQVPELLPADVFPYAPVAGKPELRELWRQKQLDENPSLGGKSFSQPIVTSALTHGIALVSEMFVDVGDIVLLPDQLWGNYRLTFEVRQQGEIRTYPFFDGDGFNLAGFGEAVDRESAARGKLIVMLNFPNNPTGYTPTEREVEGIVDVLVRAAREGRQIVAVCDDAYFNLVYEDTCIRESIFGHLAGQHENLLAIRLDGATKEQFVWGFRVGFLTFAVTASEGAAAAHEVLEKKTAGAIRGGVSNSPHLSQSILLHALRSPGFQDEMAAKRAILGARARRVKELLANPEYSSAWDPYPFNSGYFHCLRLKTVDAEPLQVHLLDAHGLGVIATGPRDIRVAFSCLEVDQLEEVYSAIHQGIRELEEG